MNGIQHRSHRCLFFLLIMIIMVQLYMNQRINKNNRLYGRQKISSVILATIITSLNHSSIIYFE